MSRQMEARKQSRELIHGEPKGKSVNFVKDQARGQGYTNQNG